MHFRRAREYKPDSGIIVQPSSKFKNLGTSRYYASVAVASSLVSLHNKQVLAWHLVYEVAQWLIILARTRAS